MNIIVMRNAKYFSNHRFKYDLKNVKQDEECYAASVMLDENHMDNERKELENEISHSFYESQYRDSPDHLRSVAKKYVDILNNKLLDKENSK